MRTIRTTAAVVVPLAIATSVLTMGPAFAKGGGGRLQVEFEVDSNVVGQTWAWQLKDNGARVAVGQNKTVAPSGSFDVRRFINNQAGADKINAAALNRATNEVCAGSVTF
jgi:hypothetical protein